MTADHGLTLHQLDHAYARLDDDLTVVFVVLVDDECDHDGDEDEEGIERNECVSIVWKRA